MTGTIVNFYDLLESQIFSMFGFIDDNSLLLSKYRIIEVGSPLESHHFVYEFEFKNDEDALIFKLRWPDKP